VGDGSERVDGQVDGGGGELALGDQVQYPGLNLGLPELIRRAMMELGQIINPGGVGLHGSLGPLLKDQMFHEPPAQRADASRRRPCVGVGGGGGADV